MYEQISKQVKTTYLDYKKIKGFEDVGYFLVNYVVSGGEVTKDITENNKVNVAMIVVVLNNDVQTREGTSFKTKITNTTYYLDFFEGDFTWGTSHPSGTAGVDYLTIAEVTTDANGNVLNITDTRGPVGGFRLKSEYGLEELMDIRTPDPSYTPERPINVAGDITRDMQARLVKTFRVLSVEGFGIVGNGETDESIKFQQAIDAAAAQQAKLFIPDYMVIRCYGITITCDMFGGGTIMNNNRDGSIYDFCKVTAGVTIEGLTFDGWVTDDPVTWDSTNYNSFQGAIALYVTASGVRLINCQFQNSVNSPLRIENSSDVYVINCKAKRGRGNFGDGFYTANSNDIHFIGCRAEDVTRIGFVTEKGSGVSYNITYADCVVKDAHDASINYGGAESNGGFWSENSGEVKYVNCHAENTGNRGFVCTTGTAIPGYQQASYELSNCSVKGSGVSTTGFLLESINGIPVNHKLVNCRVENANVGFQVNFSTRNDHVSLDNCHASVLGNGNNSYAYAYHSPFTTGTDLPTLFISNCTSHFSAPNETDITSSSTNTGDFSTFSGGSANIIIDKLYNVSREFAVIKLRSNNPTGSVKIDKSHIQVVQFVSSQLHIRDCKIKGTIHGVDLFTANCSFIGTVVIASTGRIEINGGTAEILQISNSTSSNKLLYKLRGITFEGDVTAAGYLLRIQLEGANKPKSLFSDLVFYNSAGTANTGNTCVWLVRSGTTVFGDNCVFDNTVPFFQKLVSTDSTPEYATAAVMH